MPSEAPTKRRDTPTPADTHSFGKLGEGQADADRALLETEPNWDRAAEIAKRLLSTPPDRQAVGKALAPKRPMVKQTGRTGG